MKRFTFGFLILIFWNFQFSDGYKVLVFNPAFGASHSNFLGKISDILIDAGHDVTMLIPISMQTKKDLVGSKKVKKIIRIDQDPRSMELNKASGTEDIMRKKIWKMDSDITVFLSMAANFSKSCGYQCEYNFQQTKILENLRNENFDLGISESLFICGFALFDHIGLKTVINADSVLLMNSVKYALGEPAAASYYPGLVSPISDKMSFVQRAQNTIRTIIPWYFSKMRYDEEMKMIKNLYNPPVEASWENLLENIAFNFINSNQYLDYPTAVLPKTVYIGGMQVRTKSHGNVHLDKEWDEILGKRKKNVLISFGSNAYSMDMPDEFKSAFLSVFASMPDVTFIWKYEEANATLADHLPNVHLTTWMPQNDLLADDRLTLFVTHGGLGSSVELAYQGKPAVVIPLMADQPRNAHMLTRHGGAIELDKTKLDRPEEIKKAIETVLNDKNYAGNAERLAKILEDQPHKPKDVVLKHCDFAVKFGPLETLNSEGRHLNTFQFYSLDILLAAILLVLIVLYVLHLVIKMTWRFAKRTVLSSKKKVE